MGAIFWVDVCVFGFVGLGDKNSQGVSGAIGGRSLVFFE